MFRVHRLDPEMPKTQKKMKRGIRKYTKETPEIKRERNQCYRNEINSGFNLLMKWVPYTETLIRAEILIETVNYIKKLQNEIKEVKEESLKKSKKLKNKIKELEKECKKVNYIKELQKKIKELETSQTGTDSARREPHSSPMDISEPVKIFASTPTGASMRKTSSTMDVTTTSEAESDILTSQEEEKLLASPEEVGSPDEELPEEELLASGIPEFNSMEDFTQWLEQ
jgi:hypothetical protein